MEGRGSSAFYFTDLEPFCLQARALFPFPYLAFASEKMSGSIRRKAFDGLAQFIVEEWTSVRPEASRLPERRRATLAFLAIVSASELESMRDKDLQSLWRFCVLREAA